MASTRDLARFIHCTDQEAEAGRGHMGNWEWSYSKDQASVWTPLDPRSLQITSKQQGLTLNLLVPLSQDHANFPPSTSHSPPYLQGLPNTSGFYANDLLGA